METRKGVDEVVMFAAIAVLAILIIYAWFTVFPGLLESIAKEGSSQLMN